MFFAILIVFTFAFFSSLRMIDGCGRPKQWTTANNRSHSIWSGIVEEGGQLAMCLKLESIEENDTILFLMHDKGYEVSCGELRKLLGRHIVSGHDKKGVFE